jgi:hypothetical protein
MMVFYVALASNDWRFFRVSDRRSTRNVMSWPSTNPCYVGSVLPDPRVPPELSESSLFESISVF